MINFQGVLFVRVCYVPPQITILGVSSMFFKKKKSEPAERITLTMSQVYWLALAAFKARSFPDVSLVAEAHRIVWLEQRGLPGLMALAVEFTKLHNGKPWTSRTPIITSDNQMKFDCPFITGAALQDYLPELVSENPEDVRGINGPTNPFLLLPRRVCAKNRKPNRNSL